jgi:enterochelin esterase family protein
MRKPSVCVLTLIFILGNARVALGDSTPCKCNSPDDQYVLGSDSQPQSNIPEGKVSEFRLQKSKAYPGFEFTWWLYVPAQYDGKRSIALMVFQDGTAFVTRDGDFRVPTVLNNLIAKKELPVMAAVFVDPGEAPHGVEYAKASDGSPLFGNTYRISARSREYESLNAVYANFLVDEILPQVRKQVKITDDPEGRGVGGLSSGANCAITVAWERPDQFRKVFSAIGSFPSVLRGVPGLPKLVRASARKPLRIFLQDGTNDIALPFAPEWGSGAERHKDLVAALKDERYEYQYVLGEGSHSAAHAASIFPEAMRWLWRDYPR